MKRKRKLEREREREREGERGKLLNKEIRREYFMRFIVRIYSVDITKEKRKLFCQPAITFKFYFFSLLKIFFPFFASIPPTIEANLFLK